MIKPKFFTLICLTSDFFLVSIYYLIFQIMEHFKNSNEFSTCYECLRVIEIIISFNAIHQLFKHYTEVIYLMTWRFYIFLHDFFYFFGSWRAEDIKKLFKNFILLHLSVIITSLFYLFFADILENVGQCLYDFFLAQLVIFVNVHVFKFIYKILT